MAEAYVEHNGRKISLEEYEATVTMYQSERPRDPAGMEPELVSEYETGGGPSLEDIYMMVFIQGQRIYDLLALIATGNPDLEKGIAKLIEVHSKGGFLAPVPEISPPTTESAD